MPPNAKKYVVNSNHGATNAMINLYVPHAASNEILNPKPPLAQAYEMEREKQNRRAIKLHRL